MRVSNNFVDNNWSKDKGIQCPICGYDYAHISDITECGDGVGVLCIGECGHKFRTWIFEHKGKIFFEREVLDE